MKAVVVTGASRGIGLETVLAFSRASYRVFAGARHPSQADQLREALASERGFVEIVELDVDSDASVHEAFARIARDVSIDVLVNNAGIQVSGSVEEIPMSVVRAVMETNFFGALRCIQAVAGSMRQRRTGCIVNVSSGSGAYSHPPFAAYSASKWALEAMSEALAAEMKTFGVHVAIIQPVLISTAMSEDIATTVPRSVYRQPERFANFYKEGLKQPVPAKLVADAILNVAKSGTWTLRHPVGPAAAPILAYRKQMTDEEWIDAHACDDKEWDAGVAELNAFIAASQNQR